MAVVPIVLVGNKKDVRKNLDVRDDFAKRGKKFVNSGDANLAAHYMHFHAYLECSAKWNIGVREVFEDAVEAIFAKKGIRISCFH